MQGTREKHTKLMIVHDVLFGTKPMIQPGNSGTGFCALKVKLISINMSLLMSAIYCIAVQQPAAQMQTPNPSQRLLVRLQAGVMIQAAFSINKNAL